MNKEIEKAKEDLSFMNEGDYITKEMSDSARVLKEYIKQLEQKETILDKVTDKLEEDAREEEGYIKWLDERTKEIVQPRKTIVIKSDYARSILNIIEGGNGQCR